MTDIKELDFEETLNRLEQVVQGLESGNMSLEQALKAFEEGVKLVQAGQAKLDNATQRIQILQGKDEHATLQPFHSSEQPV